MTKQPIGEFIAALRKDAGYTQQDVADKLNISDRTLSSWETDRTEPDLSSLSALADLYGVTADEILRGKRKGSAPEIKQTEPEQINPLKERFADFISALHKLTALGSAFAAVVFAGCILILYAPVPLWADVMIMLAGAAGNAVCVGFIFRLKNRALITVADGEKGVALTVNHKAATALILNSLAYIAGVIVLLMCYWFVSYYDRHHTGTVDENYDLYTTAAVVICFVFALTLLIFAVSANLAHVNCLGNERQKSAVKANVKLFKIISSCGAAFMALCLIPYAVFCHINFTETEETYFTAKGVDEVYKNFQTYSLDYEKIFYDRDDGNVTIIPKGEYYLDFGTEKYVNVSVIAHSDYEYDHEQRTMKLYDLGNNFYSTENLSELNGLSYDVNVSVYYLKDGVNAEDISLEKDYNDYFYYIGNYAIVRFTSSENEPLVAVSVKYFWKRNRGYFDDEGWRYDYDVYYNIRDELAFKRDGDEYKYCLITHRNYTPLATLVYLGTVCVTACACVGIQLIKRKKIIYSF